MFLIFALGLNFYSDILNNYGFSESYADEFQLIEDKNEDIYSASIDMKTKTQDSAVSDEDAEDEMYRGMQAGIRSKPYTPANLMSDMVQVYGRQIGLVPKPVLWTLGTIITVLTVFAILYFIRGIPQK